MNRAREDVSRNKKTAYYEQHHIIADFLFIESKRNHRYKKIAILEGDPNSPDNLVLLTPKEHILAHVLLYRMYRDTEFATAYANSLNIMLVKKGSRISGYGGLLSTNVLRQYEARKKRYAQEISKLHTGTVIVKDATSGEMIGRVSKQDPRYLSGEYIFYQKGLKRDDDYRRKRSKPGLKNSNSSGFEDDLYELSYIKCCRDIGFVASKAIWILWAKKNNEIYLTTIKPFRFGGKGERYLYEAGENELGVKYDSYYTRNKNNWAHLEKVKHKWEN
jgi:hypothetical protein